MFDRVVSGMSVGSADRPVVLIVDDEPEILTALNDSLGEEFDVIEASSGRQALDLLVQKNDVAVIISDQKMRGMSGDEFLVEARKLTDAGTILLTGYADFNTVVSAMNRGSVMFYVAKPWVPAGLRGMVREAAAAFHTRRELVTERALLKGVFDNLPVGLAFCDSDDRIIRLNTHAADSLGHSVEECLGHREIDLVTGARHDVAEEADPEFQLQGKVSRLFRFSDSEGVERWHRLTRTRLPDASGQEVGLSVLIDQDVSDLMEMEQRLRQADKMQAIGTLAGGIAHDFNNLLTAIIGSLDLATDMAPSMDPAVSRLLENAVTAARRGALLTRKLLDFSRPRDVSRRPVNVPDLLLQIQGLLTQAVSHRGRKGQSDIVVELMPFPEDLPHASTDPAQLELALINLCMNAREAQPDGGEITISVARGVIKDAEPGALLKTGDYLVLTVRDRGVGMSQDMLSRIFEPFFTTKAMGGGIGLGLPMIYGFVRRNGGDVRVSSRPGAGTKFELWLPAAEEGLQMPTKTSDIVEDIAHEGGRKAILVVDDDQAVGAVTEGFLVRAGLNVVRCDSGQKALDIVQERSDIGFVVMDLLMPGMNGDECARRMSEIRSDLKILFVTGFADRAVLPAGARVIGKPFTKDVLLTGLREAMES